MYKVKTIYKSKLQKFHCPEPTVQYGGRHSTDLKLESRSLWLSDLVQPIRGRHVEVTSFMREDPSDLISPIKFRHLDNS